MFIENKYYRWYLSITSKDDEGGYVEKHHIVPRSMGGTNEKSNIVKLTFRKHFLAHWLLTKCTDGIDRKKMLKAVGMMRGNRGDLFAGWQFEVARKSAIEGRKGVPSGRKGMKLPPEWCKALSLARKDMKLSEEHKAAISRGGKGRVFSEATRAKLSERKKGVKLSPSHCKAIGDSKRGTKSSPETCAKVSASMMGNTYKLGYKEPPETIERRNDAKRRSTVAQSNSTTGLKGVTRMGNGKFRARLKFRGEFFELGIFSCPVAAHFAYVVKNDSIIQSLTEGSIL